MTYFTADLIYQDGQLLTDHFIDVRDGVITQVAHLQSLGPRAFRDMVAFEDSVILPGLINSHTHSFQSLYREGMASGRSHGPNPSTQPDSLTRFYSLIQSSDIYTCAVYAFSQMLKQGITSVCDFAYLHDQSNETCHQLVQAAEATGIRLTLCRALSDEASLSTRFQEGTQDALSRTEQLIEATADHALVEVIPGILSLHSASPQLIQSVAQLAKIHQTPFQIQVANSLEDRQRILDKTGLPPIKYLDSVGGLNEQTLLVHATWLDDKELQLIHEAGAGVIYTPSGSMASGGGITRVRHMRDMGIPVALGTGSASQNSRLSLLEEMRIASYSQKAAHLDNWQATPEELLLMGTQVGGDLLKQPVGRLAERNKGDFIVVDLNDLSMQPRDYVASNLIFSMTSSAINAVYVNGQRVLDTGELTSSVESSLITDIDQSNYNTASNESSSLAV